MPDAHTPEQRSHNMSRIRSTGTGPERRLAELLRLMFPEEELIEHPKDLPGKPDYYLPGLRLVLFSDGCFFHKCPKHFIMPENNRAYWEPKLARNKARDRETNAALRAIGIEAVRIWEHDLREDLTAARRKLRRALRRRADSYHLSCKNVSGENRTDDSSYPIPVTGEIPASLPLPESARHPWLDAG